MLQMLTHAERILLRHQQEPWVKTMCLVLYSTPPFMYILPDSGTVCCPQPFIRTVLAFSCLVKLPCMQKKRQFLPTLLLSKSLQMDNINAVCRNLTAVGHFANNLLELCLYEYLFFS